MLRLIKISLDQFNELASRKLGFSSEDLNPYKICGFQTHLWLSLSDYLIGAAFWGQILIWICIWGDYPAFN